MKLSKHILSDVLVPRETRFSVSDSRCPGLHLVVQPTGIKTWQARYRADGRGWRYVIGKYPKVPIEAARKAALKVFQQVANGDNPQGDRAAQRIKVALGLHKAETVGWNWSRYVKLHVEKKLKPLTAREIKRIGDKHILPKIGKRNIGEVTARECKAVVDKVAKHAPIGANRVQAVLHAFLQWCVSELVIPLNPSTGLKKPSSEKHRKRRRILSEREIKWLWKACDTDGFPWGPMLKIGILTGMRRGEVAGMRWEEYDPAARLWTLGPDRTKNHRPHSVYVSDLFKAILSAIKPRAKGFVFTKNKRPPSGFSKAVKRVKTEMAKLATEEFEGPIERWTVHDLRRSFASHIARLPGVSLAVVSLCLNHWEEIGGLKEIYIVHDQAAATKEAFKAWADHLTEIVK